MSRDSGFGVEVSKGFVAKILVAVVGFWRSIVFARVLGPTGYGAFHVIVAVASVLDNPVMGFASACKKRISEHDHDTGAIMTAGLLVAGFGSLLSVWRYPHDRTVRGLLRYRERMALRRDRIHWRRIFKVLQEMVAGIGHFGTAVVLDMLRSILTIPLQLLLVVFFGLGVSGMVYGLALASLLMLPLTLYVMAVRPSVPDRRTLKSLWQFARFSVPNNFVGTAYSRLDVLLLSAMLGSAAAGQYQIALQLVLPGLLLSSVMASGLFVEVSSQVSQNEAIDRQVTNNVAFASLFAVPIFFGALAMPESIVVTVFGDEYREAAPLLVGLSIYQILQTQSTQITSVLSGQDRPDLNLWIRTVTLITNLILGIALVFWVGPIGVVMATVIAECINYILTTHYARRYVTYEILPEPLRCQLYSGGIMFVIVQVAHWVLGVNSWVDLGILICLGVLVYGTTLTLLSNVLCSRCDRCSTRFRSNTFESRSFTEVITNTRPRSVQYTGVVGSLL